MAASTSLFTVELARLAAAPQRLLAYRTPRQGEVRAHELAFHGLYYLDHGTMILDSADGARRVGAGTLWLLRPFVWHAYRAPREAALCNVLFDARRLAERCQGLLAPGGSAHRLLHIAPERGHDRPLLVQVPAAQRFGCEHDLGELLRDGAGGDELARSARLLCLLARLAALADLPTSVQATPVARAVRLVEEGYREALTLGTVAAQVAVSPSYLSRRFADIAGVGFVRYIHRLRIEEASQRLVLGDEPVTAIAGAVGYAEVAYFDRCFRRETGRSPREYRREHRR